MVVASGDDIAGYRVVRVLGAGGMGTVYLAVNPVLPRQDALKVLSGELSSDPDFRARFIREADVASSLDHANIVTVYTRGQTERGQLWIAMQYVDGTDALAEADAGRLTVSRSVYIIAEVAKALDYAHRRNLVHRDVKPANFLLAAHDDRVLLADFGIARALDDASGLTGTGTVLATLAYAAPEVFDDRRVDHRADIYALGCSMFRMLTGATPFASSGSSAALVAAHLNQPPPRPTDRNPRLPPAIDAVIAKALAKNPDGRFGTAGELADAAQAALRGRVTPMPQPIIAVPQQSWTPPPVPLPPLPRPRRRGRRVAAAVGAVVVVAAATAGGLLWSGRETAYAPQSFAHSQGVTDIASRPAAVVAVGVGDAADVMSLGVQPVAVVVPGGLPSWAQQLVTTDVAVLPTIDAAILEGEQPDVVIATDGVSDGEYTALDELAPTVTGPQQSARLTWQDRLTWIGRILGREESARRLIAATEQRQESVRTEHPAFAGKMVEVVDYGDDTVKQPLADSPAANYLAGLGFEYAPDLTRTVDDTGDARVVDDVATLNPTAVDVRILVRTDSAAGDGKYNELPPVFSEYQGITVIVDDVDVIAALDVGGYVATEFLDEVLVPALGRQVH